LIQEGVDFHKLGLVVIDEQTPFRRYSESDIAIQGHQR
jgi:RecG-like helicase